MAALTTALLLGCVAGDADTGGPTAAPDATEDGSDGGGTGELPSPYGGPDEPPSTASPSLSREAAVAGAMAGLRTFMALQPSAAVAEFEALVASFSADCPEYLEQTEVEPGRTILSFYSEGCSGPDGLYVRGGAYFERFIGAPDEEGRPSDGASLEAEDGSFRIEKGSRFFELTGYFGYGVSTSSEGTDGYFYAGAVVDGDSESAMASPLLAGGVRVEGEAWAYEGGAYKLIGGYGSLSGVAMGEAVAMSFADLSISASDCGREPAGKISVRDDAGFWHDITFDAATTTEDDEPQWHPAKCDGCGAYAAAGTEDGTVCASQTAVEDLLAWEDMPW